MHVLKNLRDQGVTKRYMDKLVSRGIPISVSGSAVVACRHGNIKRERETLEVDRSLSSRVHCCPCCENLYLWVDDTPGPCRTCHPQIGGGLRALGMS